MDGSLSFRLTVDKGGAIDDDDSKRHAKAQSDEGGEGIGKTVPETEGDQGDGRPSQCCYPAKSEQAFLIIPEKIILFFSLYLSEMAPPVTEPRASPTMNIDELSETHSPLSQTKLN